MLAFLSTVQNKYVSQPLKMYSDLKQSLGDIIADTKKTGDENKGPRHSTLNVSLALALTASSIDTTQWQEIMGGIGVDAGTENGMRKSISYFGSVCLSVCMYVCLYVCLYVRMLWPHNSKTTGWIFKI